MRAVALALAGVASASGGSVVFLGAYPGYAGNLSVTGTLKVSSTAGGIALEGIVAGLEPSATGGMHVHAGFTCDDAESVGGHYYDGLAADPWGANTTYDSDGAGVAFPSMAVAAFSLSGPTRPVDGRAVVVHAADGTRVACGLLTPTSGEFAELGAYPGSSNGTASGLVLVEDSPTGVALRGTLAGLAPGTGGFHVHGGYTCDDAAGVFGHYYEGADDPWAATTATADASGAATVALDVAGYSLRGVMPVAYRALVAHDSEGTRVGCGVVGTAPLAVATLGAYPGYAGRFAIAGTILATDGLALAGALAGLEASVTAGVHVHSGYSCDDADAVGGHYYGDNADDPFLDTTYDSDANGAAALDLEVATVSLQSTNPVAGRAVVVHLANGTRAGCGLLEPSVGAALELGAYPDYAGAAPYGALVVSDTSSGLNIKGTVASLETNATGGFHVHAGSTCKVADGVGGHYDEGLAADPWTTTYASDAAGSASVDLTMAGFSLADAMPVLGRSTVTHRADGARAGCGLVGSPAAGVVELGAYPGSNDTAISGTLRVAETDDGGLAIVGTVAGLEPCADGGVHVHEGATCDDADAVGGHYYAGLTHDPWGAAAIWVSDQRGDAFVNVELSQSFTVASMPRPVGSRAVVLHAPDGTRVACGTVAPTAGAFAFLAAYPGVESNVTGTLLLTESNGTVSLTGTLAGVEASVSGAGVHVHSGYSCDDASAVGGHYYGDNADDPWLETTYDSDADGAAAVSVAARGLSVAGANPCAGRAVVVHDAAGARVACGVLAASEAPAAGAACPTEMPTPRPTSSPTRKSKMHVSSSKRAGLNFAGILLIAAFALGPITFGVLCYPAKPRGGPGSLFQKGFTWDGDKAKDPDRWSERL